MKVKFSEKTKNDFKKYRDFLKNTKYSNNKSYQKYQIDGMNNSLKNNIRDDIEDKDEHINSIFPKEYEYNSKSHKMYVYKQSHYVIFYKVISTKKGNSYISIEKCIHSTELRKELDRRGIEPLKNCDKSLLSDLEEIYHEDEVKLRDDKDDSVEEIEKEDTDENGNPRQYKTGPRGGQYFRVKINGKWGPWNSVTNESKTHSTFSLRNLKQRILESKTINLIDYLRKYLK